MNNKLLLLLVFLSVFSWGQKTTYSLEEAINYAAINAYAIQNADDDIAIAKKKVWETTSMGFPQINAKIDYQNFIEQPVQLIPATFFGGPPDEFAEMTFGTKQNINTSATLTQLLFNGSYLVGLQSAKVYKEISESIKVKTISVIKEAVTNAYAGVLMTDTGIDILKKNKTILDKNLADTKEIFKNGFAEEQDVEQLQLTLSGINNEIKNLERMRTYNLKMLQYIMGYGINNEIQLTDSLESLLISNKDLEITKETFDFQSHIDYKISENSIRANKLLIKLEKSKVLPSLTAFINYGLAANNEEFKFFNKDQKWLDSSVFGAQLNIPIFSSLKRYSRIQQAKIGLTKAERELNQTIQKLKLEHETALLNYQNALESFQTSKESLTLAESIEKKENIKFFEGVSTSFALTNAQNQLYSQQQKYLQAIFNLISKKAALKTALNK
jgi:outer membrane protein TolC